MKRIGLILGAFLVFSLACVPFVSARVISEEENIIISADEVIDDDLFVAGSSVTIEGTVNGDVYVAGGMITISGTINGDVLAGGGTVNITGTVEDDVRIAGGNLFINSATIGDSVSAVGGSITVDRETTIGGAFIAGGGTISSSAAVTRGVMVGAGTFTLNGSVGRDVVVGGDALTLGKEANITGDVEFMSDSDADVIEGAVIGGEIRNLRPNESGFPTYADKASASAAMAGVWLGFNIWSYLSAVVFGVVLLVFFRKLIDSIVIIMDESTKSSALWGILMLFVSVPLVVFLLVTFVGVPLGLFIANLFIWILYLSKIFAGLWIGRWIVKKLNLNWNTVYVVFPMGLLVFKLLTFIPVIGWLFGLAFVVLTTGAIFLRIRYYIEATR